MRETRPFELKAEIDPGAWCVVGGQKAYVADIEEVFINAQGRTDARLRVVFDNGTESDMLMRSLQRALYKDEAGRRITDPVAGPLFSGAHTEDDLALCTIYVLRSRSEHPTVAANRDLVHKIGVTNMSDGPSLRPYGSPAANWKRMISSRPSATDCTTSRLWGVGDVTDKSPHSGSILVRRLN